MDSTSSPSVSGSGTLHMGSGHPINDNSPFQRQPQSNTPNFLFGAVNKRRSLAIPPSNSHHYSDGGANEWNARGDNSLLHSNAAAHLSPSSLNKSVHWSPALVREVDSGTRLDRSRTANTSFRPGPPLRSIRDELKMHNDSSVASPNMDTSSIVDIPMEQSPVNENDDGSAYWVTVFGFAPEDAAHVLQLFSRHGTIVAHRFPERGNWVYIRYSSTIHVQQALSRNGRVIEGRIRLGVMPIEQNELANLGEIARMDTSLRPSSRFNESARLNTSCATPLNHSSLSSALNSTNNQPYRTQSLRIKPSSNSANRPTMRSLTAAFNSLDNQFNVNAVRQPAKDEGILQKIWNYLP